MKVLTVEECVLKKRVAPKYKPVQTFVNESTNPGFNVFLVREGNIEELWILLSVQPSTRIHGTARVEGPYIFQVLIVYKRPDEVKGTHNINILS